MLNAFSTLNAFAVALSSGFGGCFYAIETVDVGVVTGWAVGLAIGVVVFNLMMRWLASDRYYRPSREESHGPAVQDHL